MKTTKKFLSIILAILMIISVIPITSSANTYAGMCGDDLMWSYNTTNYTLTISGKGDMPNYSVDTYTSWRRNGYDIRKVIIRSNVTSIGDYAFYACSNLTSMTIPNKVTRIGKGAFLNCTGLTSVTIGNGVTEIGEDAFANCYNITDVYYNGTEENWNNISIGANNDVLLHANMTFIPNDVCGENTTWKFDEATGTLTVSGTGAMYDYEYNDRPWEKIKNDITNVVINDGVTKIGGDTFFNCDNLVSVTIPDSVRIIGESAFCGCDILTNVTIPDKVTTIEDRAFDSCPGLTSMAVPDSVTKMGNGVFNGCANMTSVTIGDGVTKIGSYTFFCCNGLISVTIGDRVKTIDEMAFYACTSLTNITIPDSVTTIGVEAFSNCYKLTTLTIPDSVTSVGNSAFYECSDLTSVIIGDGVTKIDYSTFDWCSELTNVTIGSNVKTISSAFSGCYKLSGFTVDNNNSYFSNDEYGVLFNKDKTTLIKYPCGNIRTSYIIPDSVITIDSGAFSNAQLTEIIFGNNITSVGNSAFSSCKKLSRVVFNDKIKSISKNMFYGCEGLRNITIPGGVTEICESAFQNCKGLVNVTIPDTVTTIGKYAFQYCDNITDIYFSGTEQQWKQISVNAYNAPLYYSTIHYNHIHQYTLVVTPATCTEQGYTTYTCECGDSYVDDYVGALGHTPATAVEENYVAPTCTKNGNKDVVVYCSVCDEEISRTTETINATGHTDVHNDGICDSCDLQLCDHNCHKEGITGIVWRIINVFNMLFGLNKTCDCGVKHY